MQYREIDVLFDGPPGPESCKFIDVHYAGSAESLRVGEWFDRGDGTWALRFTAVAGYEDDGFAEVFQDNGGQYRWHRKAANGQVVSGSQEGFETKAYAFTSARQYSGVRDIRDLV